MKYRLVCVAMAVAGLTSGQALAADLGGNCCADLEERIAELEATTARKGNRKVSLTIAGWVNEAVFFWDDGVEQNAYVGTNSLEQDRINITGDAKINADWSAGYRLEMGINGAPSNGFSQDDPTGGKIDFIGLRQAHWYLKSKTFGKFSVGKTGTATYHLLDDADATNTRNYADAEAATVALGAFKIREGGAFTANNLKWTDLTQGVQNDTPGQNGRKNVVRYDSPEFYGFVLSASWGEDDMWGTGLSYKGDFGDFKLAAKVGYENSTDELTSKCSTTKAPSKGADCEWWGAAATLMHAPTGLYVYGGYGEQRDDGEHDRNPAADNTDTIWFVQAGIEKKFFSLGKTTVFGEYRQDDAGTNLDAFVDAGKTVFIQNSNIDFWAGGIVQNIEAASMDLYAIYRHAEGDYVDSAAVKHNLDDFDILMTGARITF